MTPGFFIGSSSVCGLGAAEFAFLHPREIGANLFADFLDGMFRPAFSVLPSSTPRTVRSSFQIGDQQHIDPVR